MTDETIEWSTEKRKISDLIPTEKNPRVLTEAQKDELKKSLLRFGLAEIPAVNLDKKILAGHQRIKILSELDADREIDVRVPSRLLTGDEADEYLIRSNRNSGSWDFEKLEGNFDLTDLEQWGFSPEELEEQFSKLEVDFREFDEGVESDVAYQECPHCGKSFPK